MSKSNYDLTGKVLGYGRYRLKRCIKRSKMSSVYQGIDLRLQRLVAVKIMNSNLDSTFLPRFQREAQVMARLNHANIIPIYDYGEQEGLVYLVMPYLSNGSLQDDLDRHGSLSLQETCTYIEQVADALDYAHTLKIIHRDVKPSNFLLHRDGRLLLTDFGIVRMRHNDGRTSWPTLTDKRTPIGTPGYIAPEVLQGMTIDYHADIYALGIVLYQMLSGDIPFKGNAYAILIQQLQEVLPSLHRLNPTIPSKVDAVVRRATAREPERRFSSAGALAQALRQAAITYTLPTSYSTAINSHYKFELPSDENFSRTQKVPTVLQEQYTPTFTPDISIRSATVHTRETHPVRPVRKKVSVLRFSIVTLLTIALITCGLVLSFAINWWQQAPSPVVMVPFPVPISTPALLPQQQAAEAVTHYYDTWNKRSYTGAYSQLEPTYQKMHAYSTLLSSYENTVHSSITINGITQLSNNVFEVMITDFAVEKSTSGRQTIKRVYYGYFIVKKENGTWRLTPYFKY